MSLIEFKDVNLSYENRRILSDLTFNVNQGDYLCIVGENGSGKSTLVKALLGMRKIDSGTIEFGDGLKRTEIGYMPQQTDIQRDFPATVREVVISGCQNSRGLRPFYNKQEKQRAAEAMEKLGVLKSAEKTYRNLSGGLQQRVLLARALCATKKLLLLDEPTTGLDPLITQEFYSLTRELFEDGITVVAVSHDIPSAMKTATKILHLHHKPMFFGTAEDYPKSDAGKIFAEISAGRGMGGKN